jgi:hypothetical protein
VGVCVWGGGPIYFTTLSVSETVYYEMVQYIGEDVKGSGCGLIEVLSQHLPRATTRAISVGRVGVLAGIRTEHLNTRVSAMSTCLGRWKEEKQSFHAMKIHGGVEVELHAFSTG